MTRIGVHHRVRRRVLQGYLQTQCLLSREALCRLHGEQLGDKVFGII